MIIRQLIIENFGIYSGSYSFELYPIPSDNFNRPIILLNGKNGVGKTTFVEAIRLCLHGIAILGPRTSQQVYDSYLQSRIHQSLQKTNAPQQTKLQLEFDFVSQGHKKTYWVTREWSIKNEKLNKALTIRENGTDIQLKPEQLEELLRELVPVGIADIFFFDGEKIRSLAEDDITNIVLADTVKSLLGLTMIDQLSKDLDIFISRQQSEEGLIEDQKQIHLLRNQELELSQKLSNTETEYQSSITILKELTEQAEHQEQKISTEGGWFAKKRHELQARLQWLDIQVELYKRQVQELCGGLMPFAIIPEMLQAVAHRLELEKKYKEWQTTITLIDQQLSQLQTDLKDSTFWQNLKIKQTVTNQDLLFNQIKQSLEKVTPSNNLSADEIVLEVSDQERETLLHWIKEACVSVPLNFSGIVQQMNNYEMEREHIKEELERVPSEQTLKPLIEELNNLNKMVGAAEKKLTLLAEQVHSISYQLEQIRMKIRKMHEKMAEISAINQRIQLAAQTQLALTSFGKQLTQIKLARLEKTFTQRFNQLCRKERFIEKAEIDPNNFSITLYREGYVFERTQLSAGERQLMAIAIMWALREVSERPMPVIIDTPLSRLDSKHRLNMTQQYFPWASHQVIILATDAEINEELRQQLQPAISHIYDMSYDDKTGTTIIKKEYPLQSAPKGTSIFINRIPIR